MLDCAQALVRDTYSEDQFWSSDRRIWSSVDKQTWEEIKKNAAGDVVIYGVPIGGSYEDYKSVSEELASRYIETFSTTHARSIQWSGLKPEAFTAYNNCLKIKKSQGLVLGLGEATKEKVTLLITWNKGIGGPEVAELDWVGAPPEIQASLPTHVYSAGETPFIIPRPAAGEMILSARIKLTADGVNLVALGDTIRIGAYSEPILKEPTPPRNRRSLTGAASMSCPIHLSMIDRNVEIRIVGVADTFAPYGSMGHAIYIDDAQVAAAPLRDVGHGRQTYTAISTVYVPIYARNIRIEVNNQNASAFTAGCEFWY